MGIGQLGLNRLDIIFKGLQFRVANLCHLAIVTLALGPLSLVFQVLDFLLVLLDLVHQLALAFPLGAELGFLLLELCNIFIQLCNLRLIAFALDGLAFDLQLCQTTCNLIEFLRHRVALHAQLGGSLVHQVDGLIRQESFRDIAL